MAQSFALKRQGYMLRFSNTVVQFLALSDQMQALCTEASNDLYLSGAGNAMVDADVQIVLPAATAAIFFSAEGGFANTSAILATIAANRQTLELLRP